MFTKSIEAPDQIVQRLSALAKESPDLKNAALLYEAILPRLRDADLHVAPVSLTVKEVREKMEKGLPLLNGLELEIDINALRDLMIKLSVAIETAELKSLPGRIRRLWPQASAETQTARGVRMALEQDRLDLGALLLHIAANDRGLSNETARDQGLDPGLITLLAQNALKPAFHALRAQLAPLAQGIPWARGECYVCGTVAAFGELQENDQAKHLRCGSCGADWRFRRLKCMYCGSEDHKSQSYLFAEQERERMHVEVCDLCHGYLKIISAFSPTPPEMLAVEDLATLHLDYIAQEKGYSRKEVTQRKY